MSNPHLPAVEFYADAAARAARYATSSNLPGPARRSYRSRARAFARRYEQHVRDAARWNREFGFQDPI